MVQVRVKWIKDDVPERKRFDGRWYSVDAAYTTAREAKSHAKWLRDNGFAARTVPIRSWHVVYSRSDW